MKPVPLALVPGQLELVRPPAPGHLELVRRFINTLDIDKQVDALATAEGLAGWLREYGLIDRKAKISAADAARAREVREALRGLSGQNNSLPCTCDLEVLAEASRRAQLGLAFEKVGSSRLTPTAAGLDGALGAILAAVHASQLDGTWPRLKVCADETCAWSFYDHSKNGCSRWCTAEICGNRNKVKRYRERQAQAAAE